jgi:hypothetical protein
MAFFVYMSHLWTSVVWRGKVFTSHVICSRLAPTNLFNYQHVHSNYVVFSPDKHTYWLCGPRLSVVILFLLNVSGCFFGSVGIPPLPSIRRHRDLNAIKSTQTASRMTTRTGMRLRNSSAVPHNTLPTPACVTHRDDITVEVRLLTLIGP